MITNHQLRLHFMALASALATTRCTDSDGLSVALHEGFDTVIKTMQCNTGKIIFIGNGGSAGIASHFAIDYTKNGGMRATALNDAVAITCAGNDYGYENGFSGLLKLYADKGDILVAISSSGKSPNIINAVKAARELRCPVFTFSGFDDDNPLREMGDLNFYVDAGEYGFVECTHMALLHSILDLSMGIRL